MSSTSDFAGIVTLFSSHPGFPGPKEQPGVAFRVEFGDDLTALRVVQFTPVVVEDIDTEIGKLRLTVTLATEGSGVFDPATGVMNIEVMFRFKLSSPLAPPSRLALAVHSGQAMMPAGDTVLGRPVETGTGALRLVAAGAFEHGALDNVRCGVILQGSLTPAPT